MPPVIKVVKKPLREIPSPPITINIDTYRDKDTLSFILKGHDIDPDTVKLTDITFNSSFPDCLCTGDGYGCMCSTKFFVIIDRSRFMIPNPDFAKETSKYEAYLKRVEKSKSSK